MALEPTAKGGAGKTPVTEMQQDDKRLDDDPSPPPTRDDPYMRIALGADLSASSDALQTVFPPATALVYPFIPAPTLEMEPLDDDDWTVVPAMTEPQNDGSLAADETAGPLTPSSAAVTRSVETPARISPYDGAAADVGRWSSQDGNDPEDDGCKAEGDDEARCSVSYVRRVQYSGEDGAPPYHLLHGQVWRGRSADRKRGWRRHQWVVGG
jgi:hypothetical protein